MIERAEKLVDDFFKQIEPKGFKRNNINDSEVEFSDGNSSFKILWKNSNIILLSGDKKLCEWQLSESSTNKDIELISDEFYEFVVGKKEEKIQNTNEDTQTEISFDKMIEKVLAMFPEDRLKYEESVANLDIKSKISFIKENIISKINEMIEKSKNDNRTERLAKHLCNSYIFGDENTKCIVTMLFFNGINGESERKKFKSFIPFYMKKTWDASWKVR